MRAEAEKSLKWKSRIAPLGSIFDAVRMIHCSVNEEMQKKNTMSPKPQSGAAVILGEGRFFTPAVTVPQESVDLQEENWVRLFSQGSEVDIQEARSMFTP